MSAVFLLTVKARDLPHYRFKETPNCYARITIDDEHVITTKSFVGSSPDWGEQFDISLNGSSTITIQLFHVTVHSAEVPRGTALIKVKDSLPQGRHTIVREHKLHQPKLRLHRAGFRGAGFVVISLCRKNEEPASAIAATTMGQSSESTEVSGITTFSHPSEVPDNAAEDVIEEIGRAEGVAGNLKSYGGTMMDNAVTMTSSDLYDTVLGYVERMVQIGDAVSQVHPYAKFAWNVLTVGHKVLREQSMRDDKIKKLLQTMHDMLEFMEEADAESKIIRLQSTVSKMMAEIHECALFIQEYGRKGPGMRVLRDTLSISTDTRVEEFIATFDDLKGKFDRGVGIETFNTVRQIAPMLKDMHATELLQGLPGWDLEGVKFKESKACLGGTRRLLLNDILTWAHSPDDKGILWLSGGAGTGKSSVANSIAASFDKIGRLGACFCFSRDTAGLNNPKFLFGNLCYQLAHFSERGEFRVKDMVLSAIRVMGHVASSSLRSQAKKLIVDTTNDANLVGPVVIVIDALDESGTVEKRKDLLDAIAIEFLQLPQSIKVLITSRDEPDIRTVIQEISKEICIDDAQNTSEDIRSYIEHRLMAIQRRLHLREGWPGAEKLQELVDRAGRFFIWASVACNFIEEKRNPNWRLDILLDATRKLHGSPLEKLDVLYDSILRNAFPDPDDPLADFRYVVGSIIVLKSPVTRIGLDSLLGLHDGSEGDLILQDGHEVHLSSSEEIVSLLGSILKIDSSGTKGINEPLRFLHPSFSEFLVTHADEHFRIDPLEQNRILAMRCLSILNTQLRFNICEIGELHLLNAEIEDLSRIIDDHISDGLRYSCQSITYHVVQVSNPDTWLKDALMNFILEHLLHWIEVMSLLGEISKAEVSLYALAGWIKDHANDNSDLCALVGNAIPFLRNSGQAIRLSALHTYYSALPFAPKTTKLFKCFISKVPHVPHIISSHSTWPTTSVRVMEGHNDAVTHVAFSPDGKMLASASNDNTVQLWDIESGQAIGGALNGHADKVPHFEFSPDGKKLASASNDGTVRLWDVASSHAIGDALEGHTKAVNHVVFSPDGTKLASASDDSTVQLWDSGSGKVIRVLKGHTDTVKYAIFSPDGKKLASASHDKTIQLWDIESDKAIAVVLKGHTGAVQHITFSFDGNKLASASCDMTVLLWDVKSGIAIGPALQGHTNYINSVTFSPDGKKLASASDDETVQVWDIETTQVNRIVLGGHTDAVQHVVFSPDGRILASASCDWTIQLWDVESGKKNGDPLQGHFDWVQHVVFSSDGMKLASASDDWTVRLWDVQSCQDTTKAPGIDADSVQDAHDGMRLGLTLDNNPAQPWDVESSQVIPEAKGHSKTVNCVVFSPDGKRLASASNDFTVQIWDVESGQVVGDALRGHTDQVMHVAFSPDGSKLASASEDYMIWLWDVKSCQEIRALKGHTDIVEYVVFSPDGKKLASTSYDKMICLWDVELDGQAPKFVLEGHTDTVYAATFSPDGKKLASVSGDNTIRLWDANSGKEIGEALKGHTDSVNDVKFSPDGKQLVSASDDMTVRLWDVESGKGIGEALNGHNDGVYLVMYSLDGKKLVSQSWDDTVRIWEVEHGQCISEAFEPHTKDILVDGIKLHNLEILTDSWIRTNFLTPVDEGTQDLTPSVNMIMEATTFVDSQGFLRHGTKRVLWLPFTLRYDIAVHSSLVAVGGESGAVGFIRFHTSV